MLGIGSGSSRVHLAHLQKFIGLLKGGGGRDSIRRVLTAFLNSDAGKVIKEHHGGDLVSAFGVGPLRKMIYSYRGKPSGSPSQYITVEGIKEIIRAFPNADEAVRSRLSGVFEGDAMSFLLCEQASLEQCVRAEDEEDIEEVFDGGFQENCVLGSMPPDRMWLEARLLYHKTMSDKQVMEARLDAKEAEKAVLVEQLKARDERSEKEKALLENAHLKEKALFEARIKEMEIEKLKMQNEKDKFLQGHPPRRAYNSRKRTSAPVDDEDDEHDEINDAIKSSPLLTMTPYIDPVTLDSSRVQRRRWVVAYESDKALEQADFIDGSVCQTASTSFGNGEFLTMIVFTRKIRLTIIKPVMQELRAKGRITGRVLVETCFRATLRFDVCAVVNGLIKAHMMRSPSTVRIGDGLCCRMVAVE